jgi:hypothetical protein
MPEDEHLMEASEDAGLELPRDCDAGAYMGPLVAGEVDQPEGVALDLLLLYLVIRYQGLWVHAGRIFSWRRRASGLPPPSLRRSRCG